MQITINELAALVGGQLASGEDGTAVLHGAASLAEAVQGDVSFFSSPKYLTHLRATRATAVLVPAHFQEQVPTVCIFCENPNAAFSRILSQIAPPVVVYPPGIHPTAVVASDVILGKDVCIQPYVVIESGAEIGDRTVVGSHSYIGHDSKVGADCLIYSRLTLGSRCIIGNRAIIHSGVVIGSDGFGFEFKEGCHVKIPQTGIVQIDDDVEIGANTSIDRARFGRTWIKHGCKLDNLVQVAHNVVIGEHSLICAQVGISGSTVLGSYVTLAGQVGVAGHLEIGNQVTVAGKSGVTKSLLKKDVYMGNPCEPAKERREQVAHIRGLARLKARVKALEQIFGNSGKNLPPPV